MARTLDLTPEIWSYRGEADATVRGWPVRVWGGIPGEACRVRLLHEGQNRGYARWQAARHPDPARVEPRCRRYNTCGGCPLMHVTPEAQRDVRRDLVWRALHEEGLGDVPVQEVKTCPDGEDGYRWVVKLGVGYSDHGRIRVGAWGRHTRSVVPIPECHVASVPLRRTMATVAHFVREMEIRPYDPESDEGILRAVVLRGSRSKREVHVLLVAGRRIRALQDLAEKITASNSEIVGVGLHLNDDPGNAIYSRSEDGSVPFKPLRGRMYVEEELGDVVYRIGPGDFFQTNPSVAELLYRDTLDALGLVEGTPLVDLYSGVGGFALQGARRTGWALGIEELDGAVERAREAARQNKITAEFMAGHVADCLDDVTPRLRDSRPVVTVNPARRGLEEGVVEKICALSPRKVAYISCNPKAMARDVAMFRAAGMRVGPVALYDMFPNTPHVESVVVLEAPDADHPARRAPRRKVVKAKA